MKSAIEFGNFTDSLLKAYPPQNIWQGVGHMFLGALATVRILGAGSVIVSDVTLLVDGKPLRQSQAQLPIRSAVRRTAGRNRTLKPGRTKAISRTLPTKLRTAKGYTAAVKRTKMA